MNFQKEQLIGYWCTRIRFVFSNRLGSQTKKLGIANTGAILLVMLDKHGPSSLVKLSKMLAHAHPSVLRNLDSLEKKGFIERNPHPNDRRKKIVSLTEKGRRAVPTILDALAQLNKECISDFTPAEADQLFSFFRRIITNLGCKTEGKPIHQELLKNTVETSNQKKQNEVAT